MYKKIYKKIFRPILIAGCLFSLLLAAAATAVSYRISFDTQTDLTGRNLSRESENLSASLRAAEDLILRLCAQPAIIGRLSGPAATAADTGEIVSMLDGSRIVLGALGVYLYSPDTLVAASSNVFNPVDFDRLSSVPSVSDFIASSEETRLIARDEHISGSFASSMYNPAEGVLTLMAKVADGGRLLGYVAADLPPDLVYGTFGSPSFIVSDGGKVLLREFPRGLDERDVLAAGGALEKVNRRYLVRKTALPASGAQVVNAADLSAFHRQFRVTALIIAAAGLFGALFWLCVSAGTAEFFGASLAGIKKNMEGGL